MRRACLAYNGRDCHHLLELCGLVEARVINLGDEYDPCRPNDRLFLGKESSISESATFPFSLAPASSLSVRLEPIPCRKEIWRDQK
jgi:hypothetical protein